MLPHFLHLFRRKNFFLYLFCCCSVDLSWELGNILNYIPQAKSEGFQARRLKKLCVVWAHSCQISILTLLSSKGKGQP